MRKRSRPLGLLGRFLRHTGGNPLVQFALVAPVFFALVFMIIDDGLAIFTQSTLDNATRDASRNILLGTYQKASSGLSTFTSAVCGEMAGLIPSCTTNLQVYVNSGASFSAISAQSGSGGTLAGNGTFTMGSASSYVIVQTAYNRSYIGFIGRYVSGGALLLISTVVFQTEPYS
jgi:Flp pilus assembly protein TadG